MRLAMIMAASLEVVCRDCGECIENTIMDADGIFVVPKADGSYIWTVEQVKAASGKVIVCPSCDEPMKIIPQSKAVVPSESTQPESEAS